MLAPVYRSKSPNHSRGLTLAGKTGVVLGSFTNDKPHLFYNFPMDWPVNTK